MSKPTQGLMKMAPRRGSGRVILGMEGVWCGCWAVLAIGVNITSRHIID